MIATDTDLEAGAVLQVNSPKLAVDPDKVFGSCASSAKQRDC